MNMLKLSINLIFFDQFYQLFFKCLVNAQNANYLNSYRFFIKRPGRVGKDNAFSGLIIGIFLAV